MLKTIFQNEHCQWIDVQAPSKEDIQLLNETYQINELLLEDILDANHLPKYEEVDEVKFFLTRENIESKKENIHNFSDVTTKLGIFLTGDKIITVHRIDSPSIQSALYEIDRNKKEEREELSRDKIALILALKIIKSFDDESKRLVDIIDKIENDIFLKNNSDSNFFHKTTRNLYKIKRKSGINIRILGISSAWINAFRHLNIEDVEAVDLIDKQKDVRSDFDHLNAQITNLISMYIAISDQRANQVMKLLAIYSVYFLPITFISGFYGMNFTVIPGLNSHLGFYLTCGLMVAIILITFIYFKKKKF